MPDPKYINTQINQPQVLGDLVVKGDVVIYGSEEVQYPRILTRLPRLREKLIGREKELEKLTSQFESGQHLLLLNGMGGVGKTALATAYVNQQESRYLHICWLEQQGTFEKSLITNGDLLASLRYELTDNPQRDARNMLKMIGGLGQGQKSLLIIDYAKADMKDYLDYLPSDHWEVLITSRQKIYGLEELEVDNLEPKLAKKLFFNHYKHDQKEEPADQIIHLLDGHTLTLELLAKTAQARRIQPLSKVLQLVEERGLAIGRRVGQEIAHSKGEEIDRLFPYLQTIFEWSETTERESWLLKQFLFLPPTHHRFERLTKVLLITENQEEKWDELSILLEKLIDRGWLADDSALGYKLHRVLKEILFSQFEPTLQFEDLTTLVKGVTELLDYDESTDNPISRFPLITYGETLLE